jgi:hypothetical protein
MTLNGISIQIQFNSIQLKRNGVQIVGNNIENMFVNMVLECFFKDMNLKMCLSIPLFTHEWYKQIEIPLATYVFSAIAILVYVLTSKS